MCLRKLTSCAMLLLGCARAYAEPVSVGQFVQLPRPEPSQVIRYGALDSQAIDVFLPAGPGPHPVAVIIHGGCWSKNTAGREQLRLIGAQLAAAGVAVWSLGYRRANEEGGGYPGTFEDVATGVDMLRSSAESLHLDTARTVMVGHSAGGHLALWAAARDRLPTNSPLYRSRPFLPGSVISLAGIGDLGDFSRFVPVICGQDILPRLIPEPAVLSEISPAALPAPHMPVSLIAAELDRLVPPYVAHDYARSMRPASEHAIELNIVRGAGHFDLVTPGTDAWRRVRERILDVAARKGSYR